MKISTIVLTGGNSKRMGQPKYRLRFGPETLLERTLRQVGQSTRIVVASHQQVLPDLGDVIVVRDPVEDQGPLLGIMAGLREAGKFSEWALVIGCDMPFVNRDLIDLLIDHRKEGDDIIIPQIGDQAYPLCALYRTEVWQVAQALLAEGERRLLALLEPCEVNLVGKEALVKLDPDLIFLTNINTPESYEDALARAHLKK